MTKLILIDAMAILHRAYHAMPALNTPSGEPINAVHGFVSMFLRIVNDLKPTHIAVAFDRPETTFRKKAFENYQSQRPDTEEGLISQFEKTKEVLRAMNVLIFEKAGYEADDIIGTLARLATDTQISNFQFPISKQNPISKKENPKKSKIKNLKSKINEIVIVTGDRDILQLVDDTKNIKLYMPVKGLSDAKLFGEAETVERLGIPPKLVPDYKGLVGDPSDNYKGVAGIGPKTAINLINVFGGFTKIYENIEKVQPKIKEKLIKEKEMGNLSYKLAKIDTEVPIEVDFEGMGKWELGSEKAIELFKSYGFKALPERIKNYSERKNGRTEELKDSETKRKFKLTKEEIEGVVVKIAERLKGRQYAIRGTASMVLQGLDMGVDDIDIITDKKTALELNNIFQKEIIKKIEYSESEKFKSYFGQFVLDNILCEVMGEWQVKRVDSRSEIVDRWSEKQDANIGQVKELKVKGKSVIVTKLDLELKTSADMGRWNEFHKIKKQLQNNSQGKLF